MDQYLFIVPLLPLLGFVINGLFRTHLSKQVVVSLAVGSVGLSFLASVALFFRLLGLDPEHRLIEQVLFSWIQVASLRLYLSILLDHL